MAQQTSLADRYAELLEVSTRMLGYAEQQEWEALVQCEARYLVELDQVRALDAVTQPSDAEKREKLALLERILEQDARTRELLDARREELSQLLGDSRRQQAVSQAYHGGVSHMASRNRTVTADERP
ncbi:flagellar protein FliT [Salinicola aestuarinus]|uniref:flagellar protein FliT n=1 Tax=Salinicola aestuarinus TaxID=1949082 RepID=UPI000DA16A6C|nr:flagellar protein FliT [Salinicola aestuarinus]